MKNSELVEFPRAGHAEGCEFPTRGCTCVIAANWYGWVHPLTPVEVDRSSRSWLDQYVAN